MLPSPAGAGDEPVPLFSNTALALDLSSTVGFAWGPVDAPAPVLFGDWLLPYAGGEGGRFAAFENALATFIEARQPSWLILEAPLPLPAQTAFKSAAQQFGLRAIAYSEGYRGSCAVSEVDVGTARNEVMGIRRMSKDIVKREVIAFARRRGVKVLSHHAGDAAVIWWWHRQRLRAEPGSLWWRAAS